MRELREYFEKKWSASHTEPTQRGRKAFIAEMERLLEEGDIEIKNGDTLYFNGGPMKLHNLFSIAERFFNLPR